MYNVVKVVNLVRDFCASCQRHGLCDEATFPQNFVSIIGELEQYVRACFLFFCLVPLLIRFFFFAFSFWNSEFLKVVQVLSQCRGRTKFEQFKRGLARNDMVRAIQRCDRQMIRMFDRFMVSTFLVTSFGE